MHHQDPAPGVVQPLIVPEIVALPPEIDISNADAVREELCSALRPGVAVVIGDMSETVFCDSSGIRALLIANESATRCQAELRLVVPKGMVLRVLQVMGLDKILRIYPSQLAALRSTTQAPDGQEKQAHRGPGADPAGRHQQDLGAPQDRGSTQSRGHALTDPPLS